MQVRQRDQIVDGVLVYERNRQRSLDFSQQCLQSWVNIAIMSERVGVNVWQRGLNDGHSIKDAFDASRPYFESLGESWPYDQVGTARVRVAAQLVPPLYVGFRLTARPDSGPYEYIPLYTELWPTFNTAGSQARGIIERLPHIELDGQFADEGVPLINECDSLSCDTRTLSIWSVTALLLCIVSCCLCWNCFIHWRAERATDVPKFLQNIREQQAKYKQMNLRVTPAKPDYMIARRAREAQRKVEEKLAKEEERKDRELKQKIKHYEEKLQRRRVRPSNPRPCAARRPLWPTSPLMCFDKGRPAEGRRRTCVGRTACQSVVMPGVPMRRDDVRDRRGKHSPTIRPKKCELV